MILNWRNNPSVRSVMFTDHIISNEEHLTWWKNINTDSSKQVFIYYCNDVPLGLVNFYNINMTNKSCYWGFFLAEEKQLVSFRPVKIWMVLTKEAVDYAFQELKCDSIFCETFAFNKVVLETNRRFGFKIDRVIQKIKDNKLQDVVVERLDRNK